MSEICEFLFENKLKNKTYALFILFLKCLIAEETSNFPPSSSQMWFHPTSVTENPLDSFQQTILRKRSQNAHTRLWLPPPLLFFFLLSLFYFIIFYLEARVRGKGCGKPNGWNALYKTGGGCQLARLNVYYVSHA